MKNLNIKNFDPVKAWLDNVAYSHSRSEDTEYQYRSRLDVFCSFIGKAPQQILDEYESLRDRDFRRKYAQYLRALISKLLREGYAPNSITSQVTAVKSFFKYNDLPIGHVPVGRRKITYHNRDISKTEIVEILKGSRSRDKAFLSMIAQGGFRPITLCQLKKKHIEPEFSKGIIPCKVEVPEELAKGEFGAYFTFIGEESVNYLKAYFAHERPKLGPEDYLFTSHGTDKPANTKSMAGIFSRAIERLKASGKIDFEQEQPGKPRNVRLYNLRKWFRKQAGHAGVEYVNFWMGHKTDYKAPHIPSSDIHYFSREDVDFQRTLYREKAMPYLRLETTTPSETEQTIRRMEKKIEELEKKNAKLKARLNGFTFSSNQVQELLRRIEKLEKQAQEQT